MVPAHKISAYEQLEDALLEPPFCLKKDVLCSLSGGLVFRSGRSKLYSLWSPLEKLDISMWLGASQTTSVAAQSHWILNSTVKNFFCIV